MLDSYKIPDLASVEAERLETVPILKALNAANKALAELKGAATSIPNQGILIDSLALQEAKLSSEIENIVTTQDELFQADWTSEEEESASVKEVRHYREALAEGFNGLKDNHGILNTQCLIKMFQILKKHNGGYRETPGTVLRNDKTGDIVYKPPQSKQEIERLMQDLVRFINDDDALPELDPLIKMALIHHQFESIHPFPDGNGRIGRIVNVLHLVRTGLLDIPILYLSRALNSSKADYYRLLQEVRVSGDWKPWVLYILNAVTDSAKISLKLVNGIKEQMAEMKKKMRSACPKIYSQDLLNNLFRHPYSKIEYVRKDLGVTRPTATGYLNELAKHGFVKKISVGRDNYYVNQPLVRLFTEVSA